MTFYPIAIAVLHLADIGRNVLHQYRQALEALSTATHVDDPVRLVCSSSYIMSTDSIGLIRLDIGAASLRDLSTDPHMATHLYRQVGACMSKLLTSTATSGERNGQRAKLDAPVRVSLWRHPHLTDEQPAQPAESIQFSLGRAESSQGRSSMSERRAMRLLLSNAELLDFRTSRFALHRTTSIPMQSADSTPQAPSSSIAFSARSKFASVSLLRSQALALSARNQLPLTRRGPLGRGLGLSDSYPQVVNPTTKLPQDIATPERDRSSRTVVMVQSTDRDPPVAEIIAIGAMSEQVEILFEADCYGGNMAMIASAPAKTREHELLSQIGNLFADNRAKTSIAWLRALPTCEDCEDPANVFSVTTVWTCPSEFASTPLLALDHAARAAFGPESQVNVKIIEFETIVENQRSFGYARVQAHSSATSKTAVEAVGAFRTTLMRSLRDCRVDIQASVAIDGEWVGQQKATSDPESGTQEWKLDLRLPSDSAPPPDPALLRPSRLLTESL